MSLNRELQDFLGAFGAMDRIATNRSRREYYRSRTAAIGNSPTNPNSPAGQWVTQQAGPMPPGTITQAPSSSGLLGRAGDWIGRQLGGISGSSSAVPTGGDPASGGGSYPISYAQADPLYDPMETYAEGGSVQDLPPFDYPGADAARAPAPPDQEPPVPVPAVRPQAVTSAGNAPRKALNDQTRTEAYNPDLDGPGAVPVNGSAAPQPAAPAASAVPTQGQSTPQSVAQSPDMQGNAGAGLSTNNARSDLENAIHGGLSFAQHTFHLNDPNDPNHQGGAQALFSGVGAATPDVVRAMDQKVNNGVPYDPQLYNVRRLEAIYRWYSMNGETDKANKAAFELLQYSAGVAAQWGQRGVQQIQQGDLPGAIKSVQQASNHIPDGTHMDVQGNTATITDKRTGDVIRQFQFTPEQVFNAAMGLSNRSLYWQVLAQRVGSAQKGGLRQQTPEQQELTRARIENIRARTDRLRRTPIKGAGGGGMSDAGKQLLDRINAEEGGSTASPKGSAPAAPQAATTEVTDPADTEMVQDDTSGEDDTGTNAGGKPTQADELRANVAPNSVLRVRPPQPGSAATPTAQPDVTSQGNEPPALARLKARIAQNNGPDHPGYEEGVTQGPDTVPDLQIAHDGTKYVSPKATIAPDQFPEAPPPPSPYTKYAADVAKLPSKERVAMQAFLNQKQNAYNKQIADYNNRKKAFDQQEARRVATETKQAQTDLAKSMSAYDQTFKGRALEQATKDVKEAWDNATAAAPYGGQTFDDPNSPDAKQALAENADAYKTSIFNDKQVAPGKLRDIAYSLMTSNPNMTAERAVRLVQQLTTIDPTDATKRVYQPVGRDVTASKNVVVKPAEGGPYQFGPVHIRQDAYNDLTRIVQGRLKRAAVAGKADAEAAATSAEGSTGSAGVISKVPGAAAAIGKYVIGETPRGGMVGDVLRVAPKSRLFTPNQNAQDVLDAARRARRYVDERLKDKSGAVDLMTIPQVQ